MRLCIEGIDRLGKGTLINGILKNFGPHPIVHCTAPPKDIKDPAKYQEEFYYRAFDILDNSPHVIFDRFHLGEFVYGPIYRNVTNLDYLMKLEIGVPINTILILLYTTDTSFLQDDGKSIDYEKRDLEQQEYIKAFDNSTIFLKKMIQVNAGNQYRPASEIFFEFSNYVKNLEASGKQL